MCLKQKSAHQNDSLQVLTNLLDFIDIPTKQEYEDIFKQLQLRLFYSLLIINATVFATQIFKSQFQNTDLVLMYTLIIVILLLFIILLCLRRIKRYIPFFVAIIQVANFVLILEEDLKDANFIQDLSRIISTVFLHSILSMLLSLCFVKWLVRAMFLLASWEYMIFRCKGAENVESSLLQFQVIVFAALFVLYVCERSIKYQYGMLVFERANLKDHSRILDDLMPSSLLILQKGPLGFQCTFKNQKSRNEFFKKETKSRHLVNKMLKNMIICREISQCKSLDNTKCFINSKSQNNTNNYNNNSNACGQNINQVMNSGGMSSSNIFFKSGEDNCQQMKESQIYNLYDLLSIKHKNRSYFDEKEGTFFSYQDQYYDVKIVWKNSRQILVLLNNISEKINAEKLQELDQYKDKLLASVCHDIKTPVCQLIQFLNFALEKGGDNIPSDARCFIEISLKTTGLLMYLISDILDYSQIKKKIFRLRIDKFNLKDVLEEVIDLFRFQAESKGLQISIVFKQGCFEDINNIQVFNDANRIKQVLINLISNALKFTQQGSIIIIISTSPDNANHISISVQDTGIGMNEDIKAKLFQQYSTFNQEGLNKNGIGLGLNNCKTIVGELGPTNQFQVVSVQNEGSIFTFQVFWNNMKYVEQIKEEECEEQEEEQNSSQQQDNPYQSKYMIEVDQQFHEEEEYEEEGVSKHGKNQSITLQAFDELKCRGFSQNNELMTCKDKRSTLQEYSNQSANIVYEDCSPKFLPNQYESPAKKQGGNLKTSLEDKRIHGQTRYSNCSRKSNLHDSQEIISQDQMNIQEYPNQNPPNAVYPSINFQTSQLLQSCKQIDGKQNEMSPQLGKASPGKKVSFISNYIKNSITNQGQPTTEEASMSDQSSNLTMNSIQHNNGNTNNAPKRLLLLQQQNAFNLNFPQKEKQIAIDDSSQTRSLRYSQHYQNFKSNTQFQRFSKELDNKKQINRKKPSKSDISKKTTTTSILNYQRNTYDSIQTKPKHNILIVDDNYFNILALKLLISENENIIVYQAENGEEAVQKVKQTTFKIIFMDMQMPIMDGETSATIMKKDLLITTPVISLTANDYSEEEKQQLTMFDDFLNKPIQKLKVQQILDRYKLT